MRFAVLDLETTGLELHDHIIQVGLVIMEEQQIVERYTSLVRPDVRIPSYIESLTGIDNEMVQSAPSISDVLLELIPKLEHSILVAHNAAFDLGMLQHALESSGYHTFTGKVIDTKDIVRIVFPYLPSLELGAICHSLHIEHSRPHQADCDAEATAHLWQMCLQKLEQIPFITAQRLSQLFDATESDLGWFMQQIRIQRELQTALDQDSYRYFRQFSLQVDDWGQDDEEIRSAEDKIKLMQPFPEFYDEIKTALQQKFATYETRVSQEMMVEEVERSLQESEHMLIEAGTGTGKSLGYLIPALYYGIQENKKVIISTHTINLQEQLRKRDVPLLKDVFPVPFKAAVLKGRGHYLCLRKFEEKVNYQDFQDPQEDRITAAQMIVWLGETEHGDDEELGLGMRGAEFWRTVESDSDSCLNRQCPWFKKCFYHRARHEANESDIVITNHSLLFTDMKADNRLLPTYDHLVIDEAHHFEATASKHLGIDIHYSAMVRSLIWLYKDSKSGLLPLLRLRLQKSEELAASEIINKIDGLYPKMIEARTAWDEFCDLLYDGLNKYAGGSEENGQIVQRIRQDALPRLWTATYTAWENLKLNLDDIEKNMLDILLVLKDQQEVLGVQSSATDLSGAVNDYASIKNDIQFFMNVADEKYVYWVEANTKYMGKSLRLICMPIDVSTQLQELFFSPKESIVMTSATLTVNKTFSYIADQLGLKPESTSRRYRTVQLPSPFQYRSQALVCIPRDFPSIKGPTGEEHFRYHLVDSLRDVAIQTRGRMLVLFTSYRMLKQVYDDLKQPLEEAGIQLLGQGQNGGNRSKLTQSFQENPTSVLLGTSSFWEGVDIPGETLSCLAIVRLPFQPPSHPLVEAKSEIIKNNNQNPFMQLSVPQAVIRFKQGFGRLVRTTKDRGVVIIYDTRVIDTYYGKHFLYSLPGPKIEHMATTQLVPRIKEWMKEDGPLV